MFDTVSRFFGRLQRDTNSSVKASGHNNLQFRYEKVSGNDTAYQSDQYFGRGSNGIYNDADLTIDATVFKYLHYTTRFSNSLFQNPNDNQVKLDYNTKKLRVEWGDINAGIHGNSLVDFSRYMHGIQIKDNFSRNFSTTVVYSQTKAETRTISITGNNSTGPYYVYAGRIVEGSDRVRVDNRDMMKGQDYTLDSYTGELRFTNGNVILASSTIAVTFETLGYNQANGNVYGLRADFNPRGSTHFGLSYVAQTTTGIAGTALHTLYFTGHNIPIERLTLDAPVDSTKPVTVTVNNIPLVFMKEYVLDSTATNQIIIVNPTSLNIAVTYTPLDTSPSPGNRSALALDTRFGIGKLGNVTMEAATSTLNVGGNNIPGHAWQIRADLSPFKSLHTNITLKDVNPTFSSVQSPGFNQNEKSIDINSTWSALKNLNFTLDWQHAKRPSYSSAISTTQFGVASLGNDDYIQYTLGTVWGFARNANLTFSRNSIGTTYFVGGNTRNLTDAVTFNYGLKSVTFDAAVSRNTSKSSTSSLAYGSTDPTVTPQFYTSDSTSLTKRVGVRWQTMRWLSLTGSVSDSNIATNTGAATGPINSDAKDSQISATMTALKNVRLTYSYDLSDTGSSNTTTTTPTTGTLLSSGLTTVNNGLGSYGNYSGYYGNSSGTNYGVGSFGGRSQTNRISLDFQPRTNIQLGVQYDVASSIGDYQYNSNRNNYALNFNWQPNDQMQLNGSYSMQNVTYTANYGSTSSNTILLSMQGHPFRSKLGVQLSWQNMSTLSNVSFTAAAGNTVTNSDSQINSLSLRLDYPVFRRQTLFVEMLNSENSGYLASSELDLRSGIDFDIIRNLKFSLGWQAISRINHDTSNAPLNYKTNSIIAELGFHF